jgi:ribosome-binding protein aMBF1 (putative translation factor)
MQFKVKTVAGGHEYMVEATKKKLPPQTWFTHDTRAKVGQEITIENGLGLKIKATRIAHNERPELNMTKVVGQAIQDARKSRGLTQQELADNMGCSKKYIQHTEQGNNNITITKLQEFATAIGVNKIVLKMN